MSEYLKEGMANLWKGKEAVGGKLYLTKERLIHKPHKANVQKDVVTLNLHSIKEVNLYTSKIFGLSLLKNGLLITDEENREYRFVVNGREKWKSEIEKALVEITVSK